MGEDGRGNSEVLVHGGGFHSEPGLASAWRRLLKGSLKQVNSFELFGYDLLMDSKMKVSKGCNSLSMQIVEPHRVESPCLIWKHKYFQARGHYPPRVP